MPRAGTKVVMAKANTVLRKAMTRRDVEAARTAYKEMSRIFEEWTQQQEQRPTRRQQQGGRGKTRALRPAGTQLEATIMLSEDSSAESDSDIEFLSEEIIHRPRASTPAADAPAPPTQQALSYNTPSYTALGNSSNISMECDEIVECIDRLLREPETQANLQSWEDAAARVADEVERAA